MVRTAAGGRIALINTQVERLFGYRRAELPGQPVAAVIGDVTYCRLAAETAAQRASIIPMEDRQPEVRVLSAVARGERVEEYRARRSRRDGDGRGVANDVSHR